MLAVAAVALLGLLAGCGSSADPSNRAVAPTTLPADAPTQSLAGFQRIIVRVVAADGSVVQHCMLLADREALRRQGLMGITDPGLDGNDGMLFVFDENGTDGFWMKDTVLPLSIAFADAHGTITETSAMDPCPPETQDCPVYRPTEPYRMAVEVAQGRLGALGLEPGARIERGDGSACERGQD